LFKILNMKKITLSAFLLFIAITLKAQDDEQKSVTSQFVESYLLYLIVAVVLIFVFYYHFLRYTFNLKDIKKKMNYTNKLLEIIASKETVSKDEIEEIRISTTGSDEEIELLKKRQYHQNKA
jgi:hypothetical protein